MAEPPLDSLDAMVTFLEWWIGGELPVEPSEPYEEMPDNVALGA